MSKQIQWVAVFAALVWIVGCNNSADTAVNEIAGEKTTAEKATENPTDDSKSDETSEESKATETPGSKADDAFPADDKDTGAPGDEPDLGEPAKVDDADGKVAPASAVAEASAEPVSTSEESSSAKASSITENTGDVPMWGGTPSRNMVNGTKGLTFDFDPESGKGILWTAKLGSQTYGNPTVANGKVLVGTNNGGNYRPAHKGDRGVLVCSQ